MTVFKTAGYFVVSTLLVLSSLLKSSKSNAKAQPSRFSRVISFGDSLSDTGNYAKFNESVNLKGNLKGRASNGTLWVENIYSNLSRENYAYMSARSLKVLDQAEVDGYKIGNKTVLGLGHQLDVFRYGVDFFKHVSPKLMDIGNNYEIKSRNLDNQKKAFGLLGIKPNFQKQADGISIEPYKVKFQEIDEKRKKLNEFVQDIRNKINGKPDVVKKFAMLDGHQIVLENNLEQIKLFSVDSENYKVALDKIILARRQIINVQEDIFKLPEAKEYEKQKLELKNSILKLEKEIDVLVKASPEVKEIDAELKKEQVLLSEGLDNCVEKELNDLHKTHTARVLDPNALYTVWVGMNDLRHLKELKNKKIHVSEEMGLQTARDSVASTRDFVKNLVAGGAKYIVVATLPTVFKDSKDPVEQDESERLIKYHNIQLHQELVSIASQNKGVNIIPIDMQAVGDEIYNNPASFGITNVTDFCRKSGSNICKDPDSYLFWDKYGHLTRKGNELLAKFVEELIEAPHHVGPQMGATEAVAISATKLVNNRLFALRGITHPLSDSASSLISSNFQSGGSDQESSLTSIMMASDGQGVSLPEMKKNRFVKRQTSMPKALKNNYFPSLNSDLAMGKFGIFVAGDIHLANQQNTEETTGYRLNSRTVTFGGDYKFADYFLAGIAMSYIQSNVKLRNNKGTMDINGYAVSLYDSFKWRQFYFDTVLTYGWNQNKIRRHISSFKRMAVGEPLGRHWSVGGLAGYDFRKGNLSFGPTAGIRYGDARIHRYKENGAGVFEMIVHKQSTSSAVSTVGGHVSYKVDTPIGAVTPQIRSSYDHEFVDRSRVIVTELASMPGLPYSIPVPNNDHNYGRVGGGLNIRFKNDLSIDLNYETIFARYKARDHFIFGKLRFVF